MINSVEFEFPDSIESTARLIFHGRFGGRKKLGSCCDVTRLAAQNQNKSKPAAADFIQTFSTRSFFTENLLKFYIHRLADRILDKIKFTIKFTRIFYKLNFMF